MSQSDRMGLGRPYRPPFTVAIRVAWTSIRVRLSRSVVTVSSVVLAVAFLLAVAGESVVIRAVARDWAAASSDLRTARQVREIAERPRGREVLLGLAARDAGGLSAWAADLDVGGLGRAPAAAATAARLHRWIGDLKASYRYVVLRGHDPLAFCLAFDAPQRIDQLRASVAGFRGVLLDLTEADLTGLGAEAAGLRTWLARLTEAEQRRMAAIAARGGATAVLDGGLSATSPLIPLAQCNARAEPGSIMAQLARDDVRAQATLLVAQAQRREKARRGVVLPDLARVLAGEGSATVQQVVRAGIADVEALRRDVAWRATLDRTEARLLAQGAGLDEETLAADGMSARTFWLIVLSLAVCVVGIVNTMMMAVTERFREIATMKCLGAADGFIRRIFLVEATVLGFAGAVVGLGLGTVVVVAQGWLRFGAVFWSAVPAGELAMTALAALATGLVLAVGGALLPAITASRMAPIEAMRVDA